jgi:predicted peroxiredoxin
MADKVVIFCGSDHPEKAFPPFMLGTGAAATDMEVMLFFTMSGLNIVKKGFAETITVPNAPKTLPEFIKVAREMGIRMVACSAAFPMFGIKNDDVIDGVEIGGVATFITEAAEATIVLTF